jgi:hypothetical protein
VTRYAKAVVGALVAFLGGIAMGLDDGTITAQEWVYAAIAGLTALGAVWAVRNEV